MGQPSRRTRSQLVFVVAWHVLSAHVLSAAAWACLLTGCNQVFGLDETVPAKPNYYTCDCVCSRRVIAAQGGAVLAGPAQLPVHDTVVSGSQGALLDGPVNATLNGMSDDWWQIHFDNGVEGWMPEALLTPANETSVSKAAQTCVPPEFNPNLGGQEPKLSDLEPICSGPVETEAQGQVNAKLMPLGHFYCECGAQAIRFSDWNSSCDEPCPNGAEVCLLAGSDPPEPTPMLMSEALLEPTSLCRVTGSAELSAQGHEPKTQPGLEGVLQIHGRPCPPGEGCRAGMSYQLTGDDIEFDSGTVFASDPKFVGLSLSGATEPDVIDLGPLLGGYIGEIPAGTALSSFRAMRSGGTEPFGMDGRNAAGIALLMTWQNKTCRVSGQVFGQARGDQGEGTLDAQLEVLLDGVIENQPPRPNAGADQTVECTSSAGADVTLDASGSSDADGNIAFYEWRRGSASGPQLAAPSMNALVETRQTLGQESYHLLVADRYLSADDDSVTVSVVDTTAPEIACNAPATITPLDLVKSWPRGLSFTGTAQDTCGSAPIAISSYSCSRPAACKVRVQGSTITIYHSGGVFDVIRWTLAAQDGSGNVSTKNCELRIVPPWPH